MDRESIDPIPVEVLPPRIPSWLPPLVLAIVAAVAFSTGLPGGFVLDDEFAITGNPIVQGETPVIEAFTKTFWGRPLDTYPPTFRPFATLSFAVDHLIRADSALVFHISSLLWYVGLVLAAWAFAQRCVGSVTAWIAIALFAVMPIHVETVSSLVGRADTMGVLFGVLALLSITPTVSSGMATKPTRILLAAIAFAAALLCKENMVVLPVVVALLVEFRRRTYKSLSAARAHVPSLAMFAVLAIYTAVRLRLQPDVLSGEAADDVLAGAGVLGFAIDEPTWRNRFEQFLVSIGRVPEANLVASLGSQQQ